MRNEKTPIAVEGYPFIAIAGAVTVLCVLFALKVPAVIGLSVTLFCAYFFRNPERIIPDIERAVVAPADGRIIYLGNVHEELFDADMVKISIFMSVFNVHVNRAPVSGKVTDIRYKKGEFLDVRDERATFENEQSCMLVESDDGAKIKVVQVAGLIARRIVCYPGIGDRLERGKRYGLIRFGSRLDVYLPQGTEMRVAMGERTVAGETILGYLP